MSWQAREDQVKLERLAAHFKVLSQPRRIAILLALRDGNVKDPNTTRIASAVGQPFKDITHDMAQLGYIGAAVREPSPTRNFGGVWSITPLGLVLLDVADFLEARLETVTSANTDA